MSKNRIALIVAAAAGFAFAAGFIAAPNAQPEPDEAMMAAYAKATTLGEHHKALEPLIGHWEGTVKIWMAPGAEPMEMTGTVDREWVLDGRFIMEHVTSPMEDGSVFKGVGIIGYNTVEECYESIWLENQSTYITTANGKMNDDKQSMTFKSKMLDPVTGKRSLHRDTMDMRNPRRHVSVGYSTLPDGTEFKSFEGVMEKVD